MTDKKEEFSHNDLFSNTDNTKQYKNEKDENDIIIIKKIKTPRNYDIYKPQKLYKNSKNYSIQKKKVKINDKIDIINIESWKNFNLNQKTEENFYEIISVEKANKNKNNKSIKGEEKKIKLKEENVSCACIII